MSIIRTINVCSGIGDNIWLLMKLINQPERFHFKLPDGKPQRGKQIFDILPQVAASAAYDPTVKTASVLADPNEDKLWAMLTKPVFNLSCNHHLDTGNRIEKFLPDLPTSFVLSYDTGEYVEQAHMLLAEHDPEGYQSKVGRVIESVSSFMPDYIGIYSSSYRTTKAWNGWSDKEWFELVTLIHKRNPLYKFVIIGADWDIDLETKIAVFCCTIWFSFSRYLKNLITEPLVHSHLWARRSCEKASCPRPTSTLIPRAK